MKKNTKKVIAIVLLIALIVIGGTYATYKTVSDENKLTVEEKEWITANKNVVQNVYVLNNVDVFGKNGSGLLYDFIKDLETEYELNVNLITYNYGEEVGNKSFQIVYDVPEDDVLFYTEHYVIISKTKTDFTSLSSLANKKIGILSRDEKIINKYLNDVNKVSLVPYETSTDLFEKLNENNEIEYALIPLEENLTSILTANYFIDYHVNDLNKYIIYDNNDDTFSNILKKYYSKWSKKKQEEVFNTNELKTFVEALTISDKEINNIQSNTYNYGFINNSPYEVLISGSYGGIVSEYLSKFQAFSGTEITFTKYNSFSKFTEAIANNKIDIFYNYYNLDTDYTQINSLMNITFVIASKENNDLVINSIRSLTNKTVYVLKNSLLEKYLTSLGGINIKTYSNEKELRKISKKDNIIVLDKETYNYYNKSILSSYNVRYENTLSDTYNFYVKNNETFTILFNKYIQTLDPEQLRVNGIYNHSITIKSGTILGKVARYSIIVVLVFIIVLYLTYKSTKKIKISKKIKKEDKMKYIDQLTSLKNRNYLNENIQNWNKNTIYPQATIIIDLNQVQTINDTLGYEQGDNQIKAAANVLIKTQLDNTDIMRTDGNEYLIYLVGYQEKQVVSYIRKLYKEFKNLPYEHGAAIGYSMITNDMKTIEDAINESVEDMRNKKEELEAEEDNK